MAKWRAIHADISTSGQVNKLTEFEKLLFTWMIPHADDWGVLTGDLMELKLKVMPGTDRQSQELDDALTQIEKVGLIWRYEPDTEGPLIQFRKWDNHQPIRKDRRQDPEHTLYPAFCQLPTKAGQSRAKTGHTILDKTIPDKTISSPKKKPGKKPDTPHHRVVAGYVERISKGYSKRYPGKFKGDLAKIKAMLGRGHSEKEILTCYDSFKSDSFWATRHLSMRKIDEDIDDWKAAKYATHKPSDGISDEEWERDFGHLGKE